MQEYLQGNKEHWSRGYEAENVESFVFRPYGRIFKYEFGLSGENHEKLFDFGCGQGAALRFFKSKGFDVYGVDISEPDIEVCRASMHEIKDNFQVISPEPSAADVFFGGNFDLVVSVQTLQYFSNADLQVRLQSLYNQMKPGAIIYATMMGRGHYMYEHSTEYRDGLRQVEVTLPRRRVRNYFVNITESEEELIDKFGMFEKVHVGYYDAKFREDEGCGFHYTYVGRKPLS